MLIGSSQFLSNITTVIENKKSNVNSSKAIEMEQTNQYSVIGQGLQWNNKFLNRYQCLFVI